jgi:hypothetical protein
MRAVAVVGQVIAQADRVPDVAKPREHARLEREPVDAADEVGDQIGMDQRVGGVEDEAVGAVATAQLVRTIVAAEHIVTGPTGDRIVARATAQRVVAVAAKDLVVAGAAIEQVGTGVARQRVVAQATAQGVVAGGAAERVVAGATGDAVAGVGIASQPVVAAVPLSNSARICACVRTLPLLRKRIWSMAPPTLTRSLLKKS